MSTNESVLEQLINSVDDVIESISEQEIYDTDLVIARELAEQLREELSSFQ